MPLSVHMNERQVMDLAEQIDSQGFACLTGAVSESDLQQLRAWTDQEASRHSGEYFAYHGEQSLAGSLLSSYWSDPALEQLLASLYQCAAQRKAPNNRIFPVLRCVQGANGRRESNAFHYDASLVTALVPIHIPQEGEQRGDLMLFPNLRGVRRWVLFNVLEKALLQNTFTRRQICRAMDRGWLTPHVLRLQPGNMYVFWGYRSLHANQACSPHVKRATALFHFGDPHAGSLATRFILWLNQSRARRMNRKHGPRPPAPTPG